MSCSELHPHPATQPENREKQDGKQERSEWASETTGTPPWVLMFVFWVPAGEEEPGDAKMLGEIVSISTNKHKPSGLKQHHSLSSCLQVRSRLSPGGPWSCWRKRRVRQGCALPGSPGLLVVAHGLCSCGTEVPFLVGCHWSLPSVGGLLHPSARPSESTVTSPPCQSPVMLPCLQEPRPFCRGDLIESSYPR